MLVYCLFWVVFVYVVYLLVFWVCYILFLDCLCVYCFCFIGLVAACVGGYVFIVLAIFGLLIIYNSVGRLIVIRLFVLCLNLRGILWFCLLL